MLNYIKDIRSVLVVLLAIVVAGLGYSLVNRTKDLQEKERTIATLSKENVTIRSQITSQEREVEDIVIKPDGTKTIRREKAKASTKVAETKIETVVETKIEEREKVVHVRANLSRYSLGVQFRDVNRGWPNDMAGHLGAPVVTAGTRVAGPVWGEIGYGFKTKTWQIGIRAEF